MADILIVEDEKNISNLIEMALSRHGHKTDCVFDGESCADVLEKKHFDLILLDVMLPKISGFELMDYIKGFDTPVIFITAKSDISDRVYGLNLGADELHNKTVQHFGTSGKSRCGTAKIQQGKNKTQL